MTSKEYNYCVNKYSDNIYRFILSNIKKEDLAKDIVQDTYEKLWIKLKTVANEKVKSYLFTTAYHTMIDILRREKKMTSLESDSIKELESENEYSDLQEVLHKAIDRLPDVQRSVILLRDYEGYSYKEIAEITDLNESQVKVYIYRARLFLKNYIGSIEKIL